MTILDPIKVTLTPHEATAVHVLLDALLRHDEAPFQPEQRRRLDAARRTLESTLKARGFVLDEDGWGA